jgi:hypothetical protein
VTPYLSQPADTAKVEELVARLRHPRHIPQREYGNASKFVMETVGQMRGERTEAADRIVILEAALKTAEAAMSIVEPRSDKAQYLEAFEAVRAALQSSPKE